jgi:transcriptional regulator with XRE-family HTH domain
MEYGKFFKECRKQSGMTQKQVAEKLNVCQSNSDWENDISRPEYEKLIELAKIYEVSLYDLLGVEEGFFCP